MGGVSSRAGDQQGQTEEGWKSLSGSRLLWEGRQWEPGKVSAGGRFDLTLTWWSPQVAGGGGEERVVLTAQLGSWKDDDSGQWHPIPTSSSVQPHL